jgi:1,4-alpha-glucan branching enzyme
MFPQSALGRCRFPENAYYRGMTKDNTGPSEVSETTAMLNRGTHPDPFTVLGPHKSGRATWLTALDQQAERMEAVIGDKVYPLERLAGIVFCGKVPANKAYLLRSHDRDGKVREYDDAYRFGPVISELDEYLLREGTHHRLWEALGAHVTEIDKTLGTHFAVWAPNAQRVSIVGEFNGWDGRRHAMRPRGGTGVWEIFVPGVGEGATYKYQITGPNGHIGPLKADPVGFGSQHPPETASIVRDIRGYGWKDSTWMKTREAAQKTDAPISIYEVHLGSWKRLWDQGGRPLSYKEAAVDLVAYAKHMGFTHIELMPISEFPFDGSWGYQPVGMFAPTIRFGPPHEFRDLVDAAHGAGLGILVDWVPGHFPSDAHGLGQFDGTHLYEHTDPKEGFHQDWNTLIYNYGRVEVANYLTANALYWLDEYHVDGLRVDAVASMLYRDYSRKDGEWIPNKFGGRENLESIELFKRVNTITYGDHPGIMTVAEESTSFSKVSAPVDAGGLGFGYKWNMGWMNDTLHYIEKEPVHRKFHHRDMTLGLTYAFSENFVLPISHDEVVHGKGSMLNKMPGNDWEKFANLRAYYAFMWGHPGKKLLFMGCEFAQPEEWNHDKQIDWDAAQRPAHKGVQSLVRDLNHLYCNTRALHVKDCSPDGFEWIDLNDSENSTYSFVRRGNDNDAPVVVVCNFTPIERNGFRLGVPAQGHWAEILNTDAEIYGGENRGNLGGVQALGVGRHGQPASISVTLPPLTVVMFQQN